MNIALTVLQPIVETFWVRLKIILRSHTFSMTIKCPVLKTMYRKYDM